MLVQIAFIEAPLVLIAAIAIIEISAAINAYSIIVTPFWYAPNDLREKRFDIF